MTVWTWGFWMPGFMQFLTGIWLMCLTYAEVMNMAAARIGGLKKYIQKPQSFGLGLVVCEVMVIGLPDGQDTTASGSRDTLVCGCPLENR